MYGALHAAVQLWLDNSDQQGYAHRARKNHSAANLGLLRRTALNLLQQDTSNKWRMRRRQMRANFDLPYREAMFFKTG